MSKEQALFTTIINAIIALVSVIALIRNQKESKSKVKNLNAATDKIYQDIALQATVALKAERDENEKVFKRLSKDIMDLRNDLRLSNEARVAEMKRNVNTENELLKYKNAYTKSIEQLGILENKLGQHDVAIKEIVRKTAPLVSRDDLKRN